MLREPKREPASRWNWLLWWKVDTDRVASEVDRYSDLTLSDSYKGWSVLLLLFSCSVLAIMTAISRQYAGLFDVGLLLVLALFIYLGHRWAMIGAMVLWTIEKLVAVIGNPLFLVASLLWWAAYMHAFYMAFLVEQRRRKSPKIELGTFD